MKKKWEDEEILDTLQGQEVITEEEHPLQVHFLKWVDLDDEEKDHGVHLHLRIADVCF